MRNALVLAAFLIVGIVWAQKPTGGTITAEVGLQGAINNIQVAPIGGARLRYFLGDKLAARLALNFQSQSRTQRDFENPDGTGGVGEEKETFSLIGFQPGVEYHFAGGEKLSTFAGAQVILDFTSAKTTYTNYDPSTGNYRSDFSQTIDGQSSLGNKGTAFGLGLYSGFDWYFTEKVYLGIEWGLNFVSASTSDVTTTTSTGGNTITRKTAGSKGSGLGVFSVGILRLGYQF